MLAVFKRELRSYFQSPIGYVFLAFMFVFGGFFFSAVLSQNSTKIEYVFSSLFTIVIILIPLLTMRLLSEEKKQKTDQLLLTAPVNISGIVIGKYLAAFVMYLIGLCSTIVYVIVLATFAKPNWNIFLGNFLGLALVGGAILAIGLFISSLTESQMIAAIGSYGIVLFILSFDTIAQKIPVTAISTFLSKLSMNARYTDFVNGILNVSHIIFFISFIVVFNFLTVRVLEKKRWS
ncbi:ABC transporter permease subunit [Paludicola sp. MB14-C6]|uniref:ABC transporter permease subunit n=1 Tax=Paludihabitans sp. MB14-C6 TaxID=3070656 RepID=UPI0027DB9AEC|nr:ABC transporter permease subunit [Paludicola sp. MB14-C6]WMJ22133.1 ABC transporter permease subunit [Paludicola sp. MB14-C6]